MRRGRGQPRLRLARGSALSLACVGLLTGALPAAAAAAAPAAKPQILAPRSGKLVRGNTVRVKIRGAGRGFTVLVGSRDVTRRFGPERGGVRSARLRRGRDFRSGSNRISFGAGSGKRRRYTARTFLAPRPAPILRLKRVRGRRAAAPIHLRGRTTTDLGELRVTVNGKRVAAGFWPRGERSFEVLIGAYEGLHYGRNRVGVVVLDRHQRRFDRVVRSFRLPRSGPLPGAGPDRRTSIRRGVPLRADSSLRSRRHSHLRYRWRIVAAPRGSKAKLRRSRSRSGRLVPDLPGTYRLRLTVGERGGSGGAPGTTQARASAAEPAEPLAQDTMTVEATPPTPPIGLPVQTLTGAGIEINGQVHAAERGVWVQMLILDRDTLEVVKEETFAKYVVTAADASALQQAVADADSDQLVILSGGGRERDFADESGFVPEIEIAGVLTSIGAAGTAGLWSPFEPDPAMVSAFSSGEWSVIGVPGSAAGSASQNLTGAVTGGMTSGTPVGQPGSLQGWLQVGSGGSYTFTSPDNSSLDTYAEGSSETANVVTVGSQSYPSGQLPSGAAGFHLLTFDDSLGNLSNLTFETNVAGGGLNLGGVEGFFGKLFELTHDPGEAALAVVQSIGKPGGTGPLWVDDNGIATYEWANLENTVNANPLPNSISSWNGSQGSINTIAAMIGQLAGPAAHDQVAQMAKVPGGFLPIPASPGGYTLVAPIGAPEDAVSQSQVDPEPSKPSEPLEPVEPRVAGTLARTQQSNWTVTDPAAVSPFGGTSVLEVAYQAPTEWPLSSSPGDIAANAYIAERLGFDKGPEPISDIRDAYYTNHKDSWTSIALELRPIDYPGPGKGFTAAQFSALKQQLLIEMPMVAGVQNLVAEWRDLFSSEGPKAEIDLQTITTDVKAEITEEIEDRKASLDTDAVVGDVLGIAGGIAGGAGINPISGGLGMLSDTFWLADALSESGNGSLSVLPVEVESAQLGSELAARYEQIQKGASHVGDLLVSDWGKLQAAALAANHEWALTEKVEDAVVAAVTRSAQRQSYSALLPLAYGEYLVGPVSTEKNPNGPESNAPWNYTCTNSSYEPGSTQPLAGSEGNPGSWLAYSYAITGQEPSFLAQLQSRVMATQGEFNLQLESRRGPLVLKVIHEPNVISTSLTETLFGSLGNGKLGIDKVQFFGDPAFRRWPLTC